MALFLVSGCAVGGEDQPASEKRSETPSRALDPAGVKACNEFAKFFAGDEPKTDRAEVSRKVHIEASNSNSGEIDDKAEVLFRNGQGDSDETWALAADSFAQECESLGWTAADAQ
ncbi:hypothetical protein SEA_KEANU_51 [Streptomyces phage Keanu]|nr:hypothetical protein SEA_KEANU_51 [Streptomyces phage Keanu]